MTMHVALLAPAWPPEQNSNGIVTYVRWMREGLIGNGCRVSIFAFAVDADFRGEDVHLIGAPAESQSLASKLRARLTKGRPSVFDGGRNIATHIAALHATSRIDVVELEESFGWAAAVREETGIPVVVKLHGPAFLHLVEEERHTPFGEEKVSREGAALARLPVIISPSNSHLVDTLAYYDLHPHVAEHIVNPLLIDAGVPIWNPALCDPNTILFVGRFDKIKGGDSAILAFQRLLRQRPALRLLFVGPDPGLIQPGGRYVGIREFIASRTDARLADAVQIRGRLEPKEIAELRARAKCVIVASRRESQGYTALEAMLQGCPVVCTDASGLNELVDSGVNGLKARAGDDEDLAAQIARILDESQLGPQLGAEARRYVLRNHDPASVAAKTLVVYRRAIALSQQTAQHGANAAA